MSKRKSPAASYKVGYGKPPKHTQFKKGQSGNRKGRPQGSVNKVSEEGILILVAREAYRQVCVNDGNKTIKLPVILVVLRSLIQKAAKGDLRAATIAFDLLRMAEEKGASDKSIKARQASESLDKHLDSLSNEELDQFIKDLEKQTL